MAYHNKTYFCFCTQKSSQPERKHIFLLFVIDPTVCAYNIIIITLVFCKRLPTFCYFPFLAHFYLIFLGDFIIVLHILKPDTSLPIGQIPSQDDWPNFRHIPMVARSSHHNHSLPCIPREVLNQQVMIYSCSSH